MALTNLVALEGVRADRGGRDRAREGQQRRQLEQPVQRDEGGGGDGDGLEHDDLAGGQGGEVGRGGG